MNEMENNTTVLEDDDVILPEGYAEGDDIFDQDSWTGGTQADESEEAEPAPAAQESADEHEDAPTTEHDEGSGVSEDGQEGAPTTEPTGEPSAKKLKFTARVDRADLDVEVDESELPTLYQKAQVVDRVQAKLAKLTPQLEKAEKLARSMGYETVDEMLNAAESNYRDNEVSRLVSEGVHEEIAKAVVGQKMGAAAARVEAQPPAAQDTTVPDTSAPSPTRDFKAEVKALLDARPELIGTEIPSEVVNDCVRNGKPLMAAYTQYEEKQMRAENERLSKRIKVLEQNAASAARAPVSGVTGGGPTDTKPKDDFLLGFESDDY